MIVELLHPAQAGRNCQICRAFVFDEKTGIMQRDRGQPRRRRGEPPCMRPTETCAKGTYLEQVDLSPRNRRAYYHFLGCRATGQWPDDSRVRRNAEIIAVAINKAEIIARCSAEERINGKLKLIAEIAALGAHTRLTW